MNHAPGTKHWSASSDLLRWLATNSDARIRYRRTGKPLYYYVDSDFLPNYGTSFDLRQPPVHDRLLCFLRWRLHPARHPAADHCHHQHCTC
jgi:hypothetical protein